MGVSLIATTRARIAAANQFMAGPLWSGEIYANSDRWRRGALLTIRCLYIVWRGFSRERLKLRAAALTYWTLLSLVPALAVVFSIFAAFGGLEDAEARLKTTLAAMLTPSNQERLISFLDRFVSSAHAIGGFGVLVLLYTAISLLSNVEKSFNDVWGLKEDRSWIHRFERYWPILTLGPIIFGVSLTVTASVQTSETVRQLMELVPALEAVLRLGPLFVTIMGFTLTYLIMPNTTVGFRYALIGGFVAGTLWEVAKRLYAAYVPKAITYSAIYGSLGVVPITVIWIYVSWLVALIGVTISFAAQNAETYEPDQDVKRLGTRSRERAAVALMLAAFERFESGGGAIPDRELSTGVGGPPREIRRVIAMLVEGGLLVRTAREWGARQAYVPGRAAHVTSLADVLELMRSGGVRLDGSGLSEDFRDVVRLLEVAEREELDSLKRTTFAQLVALAREERERQQKSAETEAQTTEEKSASS